MKSFCSFLVLICLTTAIVPTTADETSITRTWSDVTGKFKIVAQLIGVADGKVQLKKSDGRIVTPPLSLLSMADQAFISDWEKINNEGNIFAGGMTELEEAGPAPKQLVDDQPESAGARPLSRWRKGDEPVLFSPGMSLVVQPMKRPKWNEADPPLIAESPDDAKTILIPKLESWEELYPPIVVDRRSKRQVFSAWQNRWEENRHSRIVMIDSLKRRATETERWEDVHLMLNGDPNSGRLIGIAETGGWATAKSMAIWSCSKAGKLNELVRFRPTSGSVESPPKVQQSQWIDETHIVAKVGSVLMLWDIANRKTSWEIALHGWHRPAISSGGKWMALQNGSDVGLFETLTGEQLGTIPLATSDPTHLCFSVTGLKLAAIAGRKIHVFDLQDPNADHSMEMPEPIITRRPPVWTDDDHLLLDGAVLVDPQQGYVVWTYDFGGSLFFSRQFNTGLYRGLQSTGENVASFAIAVPHPKALEAKRVFKVEDAIKILPGATVSLDLEVAEGVDKNKLEELLKQAIEKAGWTLETGSARKVLARVYRGTERTGKFGSGSFRDQDLPHRPYVGFVEVHDGEQLLYRTIDKGRVPSELTIGLNETLADSIERQTIPNYRFFENLDLPGRMVGPSFRTGFGSSKLDNAEFVDAQAPEYEFPFIPERS